MELELLRDGLVDACIDPNCDETVVAFLLIFAVHDQFELGWLRNLLLGLLPRYFLAMNLVHALFERFRQLLVDERIIVITGLQRSDLNFHLGEL